MAYYNEEIKLKFIKFVKESNKKDEKIKLLRIKKIFEAIAVNEKLLNKDIVHFNEIELNLTLSDILFCDQITFATADIYKNLIFQYFDWYNKNVEKLKMLKRTDFSIKQLLTKNVIVHSYYKNPNDFMDCLTYFFNDGEEDNLLKKESKKIVYFSTLLLLYNGVDYKDLNLIKIENFDFVNNKLCYTKRNKESCSLVLYKDFVEYYKYVCEHRNYRLQDNYLDKVQVMNKEYFCSVPNLNIKESIANCFKSLSMINAKKQLLKDKNKNFIKKETIYQSGLFYRMYEGEQIGVTIQDIIDVTGINMKNRNNQYILDYYSLYKQCYFED